MEINKKLLQKVKRKRETHKIKNPLETLPLFDTVLFAFNLA
jgi:hypothetical protein